MPSLSHGREWCRGACRKADSLHSRRSSRRRLASLFPRSLFLLFLLWLPVGSAAGQAFSSSDPAPSPAQYVHDFWTVDDGLPQNTVTSVMRARNGYLWIGTQAGLVRYDGIRFERFTGAGQGRLQSDFITALLEDRQGSLWIGTSSAGLARLQGHELTSFTTGEGLPSNAIQTLFEDRDGNIWIGTLGGGLLRYDATGFTSYSTKNGLAADDVLAIEQDATGALWIGANNGLSRLRNGGFTTFTTEDGLSGNVVRALETGSDGRLWIGLLDGGLCYRKQERIDCRAPGDAAMPEGITALAEDASGALWIGAISGAYRLYRDLLSPFTRAEGLTHDRVRDLKIDEEGNIWIATEAGGLNRLREEAFVTFSKKQGLVHESVLAVAEDKTGDLWIGTDGGGLYRLSHGEVHEFPLNALLPGGYVYALHVDNENSLWIGMYDGGLCRLRNSSLDCYTAEDGLTDNSVFSVFVDADRQTWIGTQAGLHYLKEGRIALFDKDPALAGDLITSIRQDHQGMLWVSTFGNGVRAVSDDQVFSFTTQNGLSSDAALALHVDAQDRTWIGTHDGGLCRVESGNVHCFTKEDGLPDNDILQIVDDGAGYLWLGSLNGIARVRISDLDARASGSRQPLAAAVYGREDGLLSAETNGGAQSPALRSRDGKLWFATLGGLSYTASSRLAATRNTLPVVLEHLLVGDQPVAMTQRLQLPPGSRNLGFEFTAPTLVKSEQVTFQYKLEGYDEDWVQAGHRRSAYYTNLPPRTYRFLVRASRADGVWSEQPTAFAFSVRPYFYETLWFYLVCGLLATLAVFFIYRLRIRRLQIRERQLQQLVDLQTQELKSLNEGLEQEVKRQLDLIMVERTRYENELLAAKEKAEASARLKSMILDNMSHETRTPITAILGSAQILAMEVNEDMKEFVDYIEQNGNRLLDTLSSLLDLSRLESETFEVNLQVVDLREALSQAAARFTPQAQQKGLTLLTEAPGEAVLASADPAAVDRILASLISNAVKFTPEGQVTVCTGGDRRQVFLEVADTGIGIGDEFLPRLFEAFQQESDGLSRDHEGAGIGLALARHLVDALGGQIHVTTQKGAGTTFRVVFPAVVMEPALA